MKRKNLTLTNMMIFSVAGIILLSVLNFLEIRNLRNSLGHSFFETTEDSLRGVQEYILSEERLTATLETEELDIPEDISVLFIQDGQLYELNGSEKAKNQSKLVIDHFLNSDRAREIFDNQEGVSELVKYKKHSNRKYSFFVSVSFIENGNILVLSKSVGAYYTFINNNQKLFLIILLLFLAVFSYVYHFQYRKIQKPIKEVTEAAFQYSENNFESRISVKTNDEIGNLASSVSKLGKALEASTIMNTQEKELLQHIYESLNIGVVFIDVEKTVKMMNSLGQHYYASFIKTDQLNDDGIDDRFHSIIEDCFNNKAGQRMELQNNQKIFDIRFSTLLSANSDSVYGILLLIEDVTYAKQLISMREDLITNVSHDFRTPLSTIKGYSEAILDNIAESVEEKNEMAKIIYDEATEMSLTIDSLLDLSRIKAGYVNLNYEMVRLHDFFDRLHHRFKDKLEKEQIDFSVEIENNLEYLLCDEEKMHHVFYNLIDNAIRYSADPEARDKRFIRIHVHLDDVLDKVLIKVSDNGIGITQESIPFIFERFYKDDKARSRPSNGSGIGLSLVHSIIYEHKGQVTVDSVQDEGTTFIVTLPYAEELYDNEKNTSN
ncbi:hypothetical protein BW721_03800 [Jeotgalibaca sp. PTS2502]|uniref:HAMP domain-containing histidine kinase n=1 Tax=Jeotgalibaca sp. PTS2502 TaxID=1903686 RepID=UPI000973783C|nr:HAMP domain-containing histidine kinase [Jeotgalibaca sp. PTS2502]APZ48870.1 hypothetical protein BW721_03800 [Jeotgalibaca sp. PTS2502]